jgi:hypothetical protein
MLTESTKPIAETRPEVTTPPFEFLAVSSFFKMLRLSQWFGTLTAP